MTLDGKLLIANCFARRRLDCLIDCLVVSLRLLVVGCPFYDCNFARLTSSVCESLFKSQTESLQTYLCLVCLPQKLEPNFLRQSVWLAQPTCECSSSTIHAKLYSHSPWEEGFAVSTSPVNWCKRDVSIWYGKWVGLIFTTIHPYIWFFPPLHSEAF